MTKLLKKEQNGNQKILSNYFGFALRLTFMTTKEIYGLKKKEAQWANQFQESFAVFMSLTLRKKSFWKYFFDL